MTSVEDVFISFFIRSDHPILEFQMLVVNVDDF
jgi:hypothetical protein